MFETATLAGLIVMGLSSGAHCIGMCGGIAAALGFAVDPKLTSVGQRLPVLMAYNAGRIASYTIAGAIVGAVGQVGNLYLDLMPVLRTIAAVILVLMALYLADWWRGLTVLEKVGMRFWRRVQPLGNRLMPVRGPGKALALGMVWGWLPCGLVYSALAMAVTAGNVAGSALGMSVFGLCTVPAMLAGGIFSDQVRRFLNNRALRTVSALLLMGFAVWIFWAGPGHIWFGAHVSEAGHGPDCHG